MGWPGTDVDPGRQSSLTDQLKDRRLVPIFLVRLQETAERERENERVVTGEKKWAVEKQNVETV